MRQQFYLLTFDEAEDISYLPEVTLWETFEEALSAALTEAKKQEKVIDFGDDIADIDYDNFQFFVPNFCEIFPISVSTFDRITWMGKERKNRECEDN